MHAMAKIPSEKKVPTHLPVGVRVLVIDDDAAALESIRQMCIGYHYQVTTCSNDLHVLNRLWENKDVIDVILMDVHMDAYRFLEESYMKLDVPVIVMSADDDVRAKMESIRYGTCDYWKKPLSEEKISDLWMHAARKEKKLETKFGSMFSLEDDNRKKPTGVVVKDEIKSKSKECESGDCYAPPAKKPRVIWADELHKLFVKAVMEIGLDKAVPKRILQVMNVPYLTRENVASHLQKYRHQLKSKTEGVRVGGSREGGSGRYGALSITNAETVAIPKEEQWHNINAGQGEDYAQAQAQAQPMMGTYGVWPELGMGMGIEENNINVLMMGQQQTATPILEGNEYTTPSAGIPVPDFTTSADTHFFYDFDSLYQHYSSMNIGCHDNQIYLPTASAIDQLPPQHMGPQNP